MLDMKLPVVEIFQSIQGEGARSGTPCTFVRLAGCNEICEFCDTNYEEKESLSIDEIIDRVASLEMDDVVITGGEPTIHNHLSTLVEFLRDKGFCVSIETNGSRMIDFPVDWITVSPKRIPFQQRWGDEIKVLWGTFWSAEIKGFMGCHYNFTWHFIQPIERGGVFTDVGEILDFLKENTEWRLSLQIHKVLKIK